MKDYKTVSEAITGLKKRGYTIDFNIGFDGVQSHESAIWLQDTDNFNLSARRQGRRKAGAVVELYNMPVDQ